ncbi:PREDICTED: uncharacterized protein LOC108761502 [Trachymyrmex cornetzi]|uniref:uncharacterized protein LOC108761502 n=1 Tax=Trachymyrmex cornetzi TaxID=471704 RepID=UPI00084F1624|nr:PREDICTED: uncharacterized protein LOC108761502 [Trachymyrmex cornetzi]
MSHIQPMVAAIYYGDSKPPLQLFFKQFIEELKEICREGLQIGRHEVNVKIECFVCDTQARSFIKGTPGSNAEYGSCIKCTVVGDWDKKGRHMSYPKIDCPRRTNESFRSKIDEDHHKEDTPLTELDIDMGLHADAYTDGARVVTISVRNGQKHKRIQYQKCYKLVMQLNQMIFIDK